MKGFANYFAHCFAHWFAHLLKQGRTGWSRTGGTGRDGAGRDGTGRDGTGQEVVKAFAPLSGALVTIVSGEGWGPRYFFEHHC